MYILHVFLRCVGCSTAVLPSMFLSGTFIHLKRLDIVIIHELGHLVGLELLEGKLETLMVIIFITCLILVIFRSDEIGMYSFRVQR